MLIHLLVLCGVVNLLIWEKVKSCAEVFFLFFVFLACLSLGYVNSYRHNKPLEEAIMAYRFNCADFETETLEKLIDLSMSTID